MADKLTKYIEKLEQEHNLTDQEFYTLIVERNSESAELLQKKAEAMRQRYYGNEVYIRGLIEFSNYCKNDCYYCGIRKSNHQVTRYHLSAADILACCDSGYQLGFRTFVLQGGEDYSYSDADIAGIIAQIKQNHPDCAVTLSMGERSHKTYKLWKEAGADRYLLRHETADPTHYRQLHPANLSLEERMACLWDLKSLGYQVGTGFMVGSPGQTADCLVKDLQFIHQLQPQMVGIGPFIPHQATKFANETGGTVELTLYLLSILRLLLPQALLPATTALGTIDPWGREKGIQSGGNVVMPNLSPVNVRDKYLLYDGKICTGDEAAECVACMSIRMESIGCKVAVNRGDSLLTVNPSAV